MPRNSHGTFGKVTPKVATSTFLMVASPVIESTFPFLVCWLYTETVPLELSPYSAVTHFPPRVKMKGYFFTSYHSPR